LIFHGQTPRRIHDLVALLAECVAIDASLTPLEHDCRQLTYNAISSRYPDALFEPTEADGRAMVAAMHRVGTELLARLPPSPSP
jgi:hypothetical protein